MSRWGDEGLSGVGWGCAPTSTMCQDPGLPPVPKLLNKSQLLQRGFGFSLLSRQEGEMRLAPLKEEHCCIEPVPNSPHPISCRMLTLSVVFLSIPLSLQTIIWPSGPAMGWQAFPVPRALVFSWVCEHPPKGFPHPLSGTGDLPPRQGPRAPG